MKKRTREEDDKLIAIGIFGEDVVIDEFGEEMEGAKINHFRVANPSPQEIEHAKSLAGPRLIVNYGYDYVYVVHLPSKAQEALSIQGRRK